MSPNIFVTNIVYLDVLQGYLQRMPLHRRLYGIYTVCFLVFSVPALQRLVCVFFVKSRNKPTKQLYFWKKT